MQTLGLSESTPKSENRLKTLFWPRVRYTEDIDLLGTQGYWVCLILAAFTLLISLASHGGPASLLDALYYFLAGVGVRRTSRFAAASVFLIYLLSVVATIKITHTGGTASIFFLALLLSNVRATWLAKSLAKGRSAQELTTSTEGISNSLFTDVIPRLVWPIGRWIYYGLSILMFVGIGILLFRSAVTPAAY